MSRPVGAVQSPSGPLSPEAGERGPEWLTRAAVLAGLALRLWHYAADRTIWYDEAVLLANVLNRGWLQLVGPLDHAVAAPPLYLFLLKLVAVTCGDVQLCWRLTSLVAGVAGLLLTVPLCRRTLPPGCVAPCVWLVALSDNHVWHAVTVKPYAADALFTTLLLFGLVSTAHWPTGRRLLLLATVAPPVLCASYPMAFVLGGLLLALLPAAWRDRRRPAWLLTAVATAGTFALLYVGPIRSQRVPGLEVEHADYFPSAVPPGWVPWWCVQHTAEVFQYCAMVGGLGLFLLAPVGVWANWRHRRELVVALVAPFALTLAAAGLKAYPYGLIRLMLFIAPCCLLLGGLGLAALAPWWRRRVAVGLVLATAPWSGWHVVRPYPRPDSSAVARHIRTHRQPGDVVASDEACYAYFFRGELLSLDAAKPLTGRLWVPMDHYTPAQRRWYVTELKLAGGGWVVAGEWTFRDAGLLLLERPPP